MTASLWQSAVGEVPGPYLAAMLMVAPVHSVGLWVMARRAWPNAKDRNQRIAATAAAIALSLPAIHFEARIPLWIAYLLLCSPTS